MTSVNAKQEALLDELLKDYTDPQDILESAKYRGAPLRHGPDRATLPAWNLHMKHSISTNCALC